MYFAQEQCILLRHLVSLQCATLYLMLHDSPMPADKKEVLYELVRHTQKAMAELNKVSDDSKPAATGVQ